MTIRVDNLPSQVTEKDLRNLFTKSGKFHSINISIQDGYATVEMEDEEGKVNEDNAIQALNSTEFFGQKLHISKLEPQELHRKFESLANTRDAGPDGPS